MIKAPLDSTSGTPQALIDCDRNAWLFVYISLFLSLWPAKRSFVRFWAFNLNALFGTFLPEIGPKMIASIVSGRTIMLWKGYACRGSYKFDCRLALWEASCCATQRLQADGQSATVSPGLSSATLANLKPSLCMSWSPDWSKQAFES
jgi:hypothetical protein